MSNEVRHDCLDLPRDDSVRLSSACPHTVCRKCYGLLVSPHGSRGGADAGYDGASATVRCPLCQVGAWQHQQQPPPPYQEAVPSAPPPEELEECDFAAQERRSAPAATAAAIAAEVNKASWHHCSSQPFEAGPGPSGAALADASCDLSDGSQLNRDSHGAAMKRVKNSPKLLRADAVVSSRSPPEKSKAWWQGHGDGGGRTVQCTRMHCRRTIYSHEAGPNGLCKQCCELAALFKSHSECQRSRHQNQ